MRPPARSANPSMSGWRARICARRGVAWATGAPFPAEASATAWGATAGSARARTMARRPLPERAGDAPPIAGPDEERVLDVNGRVDDRAGDVPRHAGDVDPDGAVRKVPRAALALPRGLHHLVLGRY